ncbi:MAG TPA: SIMPL domain-containing protein [Solirubrobacteraceae bacterium]|jgi:hypothetical protein
MRIVVTATVVVTASLILVGVLGVAGAETTTTATTTTPTMATTPVPPLRTVSVQGVAIEPIEQSASAAAATGVYRQAMASAVSDGQVKAQFLASQAGVTLGQVQSMAEGGGYIQCAGNEEGYLGEQPDFGSANNYATPEVAPRALAKAPVAPRPAVKPRKPKHKKQSVAKKAGSTTCTLSTQVSLVYALS